MIPRLCELFSSSAAGHGPRVALEEQGGASVTYAQLQTLVREKAAYLGAHGIGEGCRVAVMAPKSISTIALLLAVLETGAAYIPVDIETPRERLQHILRNLDPHVFIAEAENFPSSIPCQQQFIAESAGGLSVTFLPGEKHTADLAYILYTSGSTGTPKGVCITHENARAFTDWCLATFPVSSSDRFSSIAPLHFDLSVFDLYVAFGCGASVVLIDNNTTKNARLLGELVSAKKVSVIYATPSLLSLLQNFGKIDRLDFPALRLVLFAGEVFPVRHLHPLMETWKDARFFNLYGPTETNVCTWFEIPRPPDAHRTDPYPIGKVCPHLLGRVSSGGELLIAGPNVTPGYWQHEELDSKAFAEYDGKRFYRTGDRISVEPDGNLVYLGRIDRMVKKRGYRIEPEEVEAALLRHPDVLEAAVLPGKDGDGYAFLRAFLALRKDAGTTMLAVREHCISLLPGYMVPEQIFFRESLPKTSSGKIDLKLLEME